MFRTIDTNDDVDVLLCCRCACWTSTPRRSCCSLAGGGYLEMRMMERFVGSCQPRGRERKHYQVSFCEKLQVMRDSAMSTSLQGAQTVNLFKSHYMYVHIIYMLYLNIPAQVVVVTMSKEQLVYYFFVFEHCTSFFNLQIH